MTPKRLTAAALVLCVAGFAHGADWWVDSLGAGDGTAPGTPMAGVQAAIDAAGPGDTIHIRGGVDRLYTDAAYTVNKANLTLCDWDAKPVFRRLGTTDSINSRLMEIAAGGVTLRNLRFEIQGAVLGNGDDTVEITTQSGAAAHNVTIDGCEFVMTAFGGVWNQGSPIMQGASPYGTNIVVRNCLFKNWDADGDTGSGYRLTMVVLNGNHCRVIGNTFTNTSRVVSGVTRYAQISGNRILNCRNTSATSNRADYVGMIRTGYNSLRDCEISHNLAWNDNGRRTMFLDKTREGYVGNTRIFNNTIYNTDGFISCQYYATNPGAAAWQPRIYNNLLINSGCTNIYGIGAASSFLPATEIRNNLWDGARPLTDSASVGITPVDCYNVACTLLNTTDTGHPDFLRPNGHATPQVMQGIGGAFPSYIGAVPPRLNRTGTIVLVR